MKKRTIAAIDIGSNSLKLAIAEIDGERIKIIRQERERLRLGQETLKTRRLSAESIGLSAAAVERFCAAAKNHEAVATLAVATASVREAENAARFVDEVKKRTGVAVEVLSAAEEARLIGVAAAAECNRFDSLLNIDIGGGSTELSLMLRGEPRRLFSMPIGAVRLTEKFIRGNPPSAEELEDLRAAINEALAAPAGELRNESWQIATGTSGTIMNFAALLNFQSKKPRIELGKLSALNEMLARISLEERARLPVISPQRAEVIVAGGQILEASMRALGIELLTPCTFALREGVMIDYLRRADDLKINQKS